MDDLKQINSRLQNIENLLIGAKKVLTFEETVAYTGLSKSYLYKLTSTGQIPHSKPNGKQLYFDKSELDDWLLQNKVKQASSIEQEAINYTTTHKK